MMIGEWHGYERRYRDTRHLPTWRSSSHCVIVGRNVNSHWETHVGAVCNGNLSSVCVGRSIAVCSTTTRTWWLSYRDHVTNTTIVGIATHIDLNGNVSAWYLLSSSRRRRIRAVRRAGSVV